MKQQKITKIKRRHNNIFFSDTSINTCRHLDTFIQRKYAVWRESGVWKHRAQQASLVQLLQTRFPLIKACYKSVIRGQKQNLYWQSRKRHNLGQVLKSSHWWMCHLDNNETQFCADLCHFLFFYTVKTKFMLWRISGKHLFVNIQDTKSTW